jgi:hypothetical protein
MTKKNKKSAIVIWAIAPIEGKAKTDPLEVENWMRWIAETSAQL